MTFSIAFVTGATPDKWARTWRDRERERLEVVPVTEAEQLDGVRSGAHSMALVRLPIDRDGLHCIPLYEEQQVVVVGKEHYLSLATEVTLAELDEEQLVLPHPSGWTPCAKQLDWPAMSEKDAIEVAASGGGVVIVPASIARLFHRKYDLAMPKVIGNTLVRSNMGEGCIPHAYDPIMRNPLFGAQTVPDRGRSTFACFTISHRRPRVEHDCICQ